MLPLYGLEHDQETGKPAFRPIMRDISVQARIGASDQHDPARSGLGAFSEEVDTGSSVRKCVKTKRWSMIRFHRNRAVL
jgi:hypothetical protein